MPTPFWDLEIACKKCVNLQQNSVKQYLEYLVFWLVYYFDWDCVLGVLVDIFLYWIGILCVFGIWEGVFVTWDGAFGFWYDDWWISKFTLLKAVAFAFSVEKSMPMPAAAALRVKQVPFEQIKDIVSKVRAFYRKTLKYGTFCRKNLDYVVWSNKNGKQTPHFIPLCQCRYKCWWLKWTMDDDDDDDDRISINMNNA